jgi:hypothetical protein
MDACPKCHGFLAIDRQFAFEHAVITPTTARLTRVRWECVNCGESVYDPPVGPVPWCELHNEAKPCLKCLPVLASRVIPCLGCRIPFARDYKRRVYCEACRVCAICKYKKTHAGHYKWCPRHPAKPAPAQHAFSEH